MDESFLRVWFRGFRDGLEGMDEVNRKLLLGSCARHCANSHPMRVYRRVQALAASDTATFFRLLGKEPGISVSEEEPGKSWHIRYDTCGCDLAFGGYLDSPALCDCSRLSLLYCLTQVLPGKAVTVKKEKSILEGGSCCSFLVTVR